MRNDFTFNEIMASYLGIMHPRAGEAFGRGQFDKIRLQCCTYTEHNDLVINEENF